MPIRLRGNTKHTQRNGWEPADITVEMTVDREEDYIPATITRLTLKVHDELQHACDELNGTAQVVAAKNPFSSVKP